MWFWMDGGGGGRHLTQVQKVLLAYGGEKMRKMGRVFGSRCKGVGWCDRSGVGVFVIITVIVVSAGECLSMHVIISRVIVLYVMVRFRLFV